MADAVYFYPVPPMLKAVLIRQHREHALESLVGEFDHSAAAFADQMLVVCLGQHRLISLEALAEFVGAHQAALHQELERAIHRGSADRFPPLLQLAKNAFNREVVLREQHDLRYQIPLSGDRLTVLAEVSPEAFEKSGCFGLIQVGHTNRRDLAGAKRTRSPEAPPSEGARRHSAVRPPAIPESALP
jgi:hypothetical protein